MNESSAAAQIAQNLLGRIIREFTFHHDKIKILSETMGRSEIIYLQTHKADMPRIIGKGGAHSAELQNLVQLIGLRYSTDLKLDYIEPEVGAIERFAPFKPSTTWDSRKFIQLSKDICAATLLYQVRVECQDAIHAPTTRIQIVVSNQEHMQTAASLAKSITVLMNAVGKANGRRIIMEVISERELERTQAVKA